MSLTLGRKTVFVNNCPLLLVWSKTVVYTNQKFPQDFPLFKHVKKNKLSEYFSAPLWDSLFFLLKSELLCEFSQKYFKTTEKHSLTICGLLWGEKHVFVNISPILLGWSKTFVLSEYFSAPFWDG